jgi:uncharacterized protein YndB with AHSA1/START domain/DNA-binding transcriptional ArsR family regulator
MTLDTGFAALSHPLRRQMLAELAGGRHTISDFADKAAMTFAAVSRHLRVLEEAGLVTREVAGREHFFAAQPAALDDAKAWVDAQSARWQNSLEKLKTLMETEMTAQNPLVALAEIHIKAPPEKVFGAWTDRKTASTFLGGEGMSAKALRIDPKPGGELFIPMTDGDRMEMHRGEFLLVDAPRRLVFTWLSVHTQLRTTVVGVDFIAEKGGTTVKLTHEGFESAGAATGHTGGWASILSQLKTVIAA